MHLKTAASRVHTRTDRMPRVTRTSISDGTKPGAVPRGGHAAKDPRGACTHRALNGYHPVEVGIARQKIRRGKIVNAGAGFVILGITWYRCIALPIKHRQKGFLNSRSAVRVCPAPHRREMPSENLRLRRTGE